MLEDPRIARRSAFGLLLGPFAALSLSAPVEADAEEVAKEAAQEKATAERVARKVEKAKDKSHEAKEEREAIRHFKKEVAEYMELHDKEVARAGNLEEVTAQKALTVAITAKRAKAKQGDLFLPEIQPIFKRLVVAQLKGPDSLPAQKAVVEGNPGHDEDSMPVAVRVNGAYPRGAARSTVPPSVLATLPELPECLNYLFVGRDLILVDSKAQLIVDFIPAVAPALIQ